MENQESSPTSGSIAPELINPNPVPEIVMPRGDQPAETHRSILYRLTHPFSRGEKLKPHELQKQRDDLKNAASQPQGAEAVANSTPALEAVTPGQTAGPAAEATAPIPQGLQEIGTSPSANTSNVDSMIEDLAEKEHAAEAAAPAQEVTVAQPPKDPISSDTSGAMDAMTARMAQMPDTANASSQQEQTADIGAELTTPTTAEQNPVQPPVNAQPEPGAKIIDFQSAAARVQEANSVQPASAASEAPAQMQQAQTLQESQTPQPLVKAA